MPPVAAKLLEMLAMLLLLVVVPVVSLAALSIAFEPADGSSRAPCVRAVTIFPLLSAGAAEHGTEKTSPSFES